MNLLQHAIEVLIRYAADFLLLMVSTKETAEIICMHARTLTHAHSALDGSSDS